MKILVGSESYSISDFNQDKFKVFVISNDKSYYIGDLRKFKGSDNGNYMNYLRIDQSVEEEALNTEHPNEDMKVIIEEELNRPFMSRNLMDDTITNMEYLNNMSKSK